MNKNPYQTLDQIRGRELRREVETLLRCDHPAIPKVEEFGILREVMGWSRTLKEMEKLRRYAY